MLGGRVGKKRRVKKSFLKGNSMKFTLFPKTLS